MDIGWRAPPARSRPNRQAVCRLWTLRRYSGDRWSAEGDVPQMRSPVCEHRQTRPVCRSGVRLPCRTRPAGTRHDAAAAKLEWEDIRTRPCRRAGKTRMAGTWQYCRHRACRFTRQATRPLRRANWSRVFDLPCMWLGTGQLASHRRVTKILFEPRTVLSPTAPLPRARLRDGPAGTDLRPIVLQESDSSTLESCSPRSSKAPLTACRSPGTTSAGPCIQARADSARSSSRHGPGWGR